MLSEAVLPSPQRQVHTITRLTAINMQCNNQVFYDRALSSHTHHITWTSHKSHPYGQALHHTSITKRLMIICSLRSRTHLDYGWNEEHSFDGFQALSLLLLWTHNTTPRSHKPPAKRSSTHSQKTDYKLPTQEPNSTNSGFLSPKTGLYLTNHISCPRSYFINSFGELEDRSLNNLSTKFQPKQTRFECPITPSNSPRRYSPKTG